MNISKPSLKKIVFFGKGEGQNQNWTKNPKQNHSNKSLVTLKSNQTTRNTSGPAQKNGISLGGEGETKPKASK